MSIFFKFNLIFVLHPGCARLTRNYMDNDKITFSFLVPINWMADYIVAMLYIIIIYTHTEVDVVSIDKNLLLK